MKTFTYNLGKNTKLKLERGIGFEVVMKAVIEGRYKVARVKSKNHPDQKCFLFKYNDVYWIAPFTEHKYSYHLHTIFRREL
ncbi:MAG: hypothetical protein A2268_06975 [Candidatus Raymondbacteria bacterium RifOxyA12_full_50_37]|uniref:Toxin n=1 Tax=Candidatus Raymondbacteria bacterium RIFOXYD12_FULL_49_13 TaxID=1817890 RepID=A0A1F7FEV7_UNCRA|nr:MAG: hypothetical protein A2268_06975 [Candidatus Raymondbacteria bacterium RifOxyA12_full_50_37]OGJ91129.1 MAG: hypothetical protein A2248_01125 [Candidatus Raymondbacteria bacterium RIFOXYA2_FULL_49_16]OGJ97527.1 MAG: hypothetical protein A2453_01890 [Candidatus Raymondbacteria bacterium RIFOXYC2_FULL_50_21]OGK00169.1 MAG: hypothetical protein A2350_16410 [Candidatus Raymondbacteria bacterium RifOxyB12_full_50_8]OGK05002.1 MAG: hypothetical protein A2519_10000 [Candidatus Raymondbacteria b